MSNSGENNNFGKRAFALFLFRYSKILTIIFIICLFVLSFFLIVSPKYMKMKSQADILVSNKEKELQLLENYSTELRAYNKSYRAVSENDLENINKMIPVGNDYEDLILFIDGMVTNRKLILRTISLSEKAESKSQSKRTSSVQKVDIDDSSIEDKIGIIEFSLSIEGGGYDMMKKMIGDFENSLRIFNINSASCSDGSEKIKISLEAYFLKE